MLKENRSSKIQITKHAFLKLIGLIILASFLFVSVFACAQATTTTAAPTTAPTTAATSSPAPASTTVAAKTIELKLSHFYQTNSNPDLLYKYFANKINERTKGMVKITVYPIGILNPPAQALDAVKTGLADIVGHTPNYTPGMLPSVEFLNLPLPAQSSWVLDQVGIDFASHFQFQGLKEFSGVHFFGISSPAGPYYLSLKSKPIKMPEDMKGLKIRAGAVTNDMITAWGGSPVSMPTSDLYASLEKGVIDGGMLASEQFLSFKLAEVLNNITILPSNNYGPSALLMNLDKWKSLSAETQQVFTDTVKEFDDWDGKVWWYSDVQGLDYFRSLPGKQVYTIPSADTAKWESTIQPIIDKYVTDYGKLGLPTADYMSYLKDRCAYWNGKQPDKQSSMDWVKQEILKK